MKKIKIVVRAGEVESDYPNICAEYDNVFDVSRDAAIEFVKGACLHAIGDWKTVPDKIEFEVVEARAKTKHG